MLTKFIKKKSRAILNDFTNSVMPLIWNLNRIPLKPVYISIAVEDTCFFRCKHCDIWKLKTSKDRMNLKQYRLVLKKIADWVGESSISFSGGEPFINPDFCQIVKEANRLGLRTFVNTNGFIVNQENLDKLVKAGINGIHVSIDGLKGVHDRSRGRKEAFLKAERVIKMIKETKKRLKSNLEIGVTTILMRSSIDQVEKIIDWVEDEGVEVVYFQALIENIGSCKHDPKWYKKSNHWPEKIEAIAMINRLIEMKKNGKMIGNTLSELRDYKDYFREGPEKFGARKRCYVGLRSFNVSINGDVRLCFFFDSIGNILLDSPRKIWNERKAKQQRKMIRNCRRGCRVLLCNRRTKVNLVEMIGIIKRELKSVKLKFK
jgi:MoaA/NifB/PqqE/SkfB family radical SAM enzyme